MPPRRPASSGLIVSLAAAGALVAGAAGTAAYLGISEYLRNRTVAEGPGSGGQSTGTDPTTVAPEPCPQFTIDQVKAEGGLGNLVVVIHVEGTRSNGRRGEGWICRDSDGTLYYQGHDIDGRPWVDGQNTVLVGGEINGVVVQDGSTYVATVSYGRYRVSADEFTLVGN